MQNTHGVHGANHKLASAGSDSVTQAQPQAASRTGSQHTQGQSQAHEPFQQQAAAQSISQPACQQERAVQQQAATHAISRPTRQQQGKQSVQHQAAVNSGSQPTQEQQQQGVAPVQQQAAAPPGSQPLRQQQQQQRPQPMQLQAALPSGSQPTLRQEQQMMQQQHPTQQQPPRQSGHHPMLDLKTPQKLALQAMAALSSAAAKTGSIPAIRVSSSSQLQMSGLRPDMGAARGGDAGPAGSSDPLFT